MSKLSDSCLFKVVVSALIVMEHASSAEVLHHNEDVLIVLEYI
jgi:hypothetical protein